MATKKDEKVKNVNKPTAPKKIPVKSKGLEKPGQIILEPEQIKIEKEKKIPVKSKGLEKPGQIIVEPEQVIMDKEKEIPVKSKGLEKPGQIITEPEPIKMEKEEEIPVEVESQGAGESKEAGALKWVNRYVYWSLGAGFIPIPWVDVCTVAGVQLKMLHRLSQHYGVQFSENKGKSIIAALTGSLSADILRKSTLTSFIKSIPLVGIIGVAAMPIYSGALTYAIGKLFIHHFETGGTLLEFDPKKVKSYFAKLYEEGKLKVSDLKKKYKKSEPLEV